MQLTRCTAATCPHFVGRSGEVLRIVPFSSFVEHSKKHSFSAPAVIPQNWDSTIFEPWLDIHWIITHVSYFKSSIGIYWIRKSIDNSRWFWPTCPGAEDQEGAACQLCGVWPPRLKKRGRVHDHWNHFWNPLKVPDIQQGAYLPDLIFWGPIWNPGSVSEKIKHGAGSLTLLVQLLRS